MELNFEVDARLLRELGARLVGQPHIALAELIKNSYDADATEVTIAVESDRIVISDNGHGMTLDEFATRWMRIGTGEKVKERFSRTLRRPLTGSKGVGRLAVQLLANVLVLRTQSSTPGTASVEAEVDWTRAVNAGLLNRATAQVSESIPLPTFPGSSRHGTILELRGLQQEWSGAALVELAREIWPLQPPFHVGKDASRTAFAVRLITGDADQEQSFAEQMTAVLSLWTARLTGTLLPAGKLPPAASYQMKQAELVVPADPDGSTLAEEPGLSEDAGRRRTVRLVLEFDDGTRIPNYYTLTGCHIDKLRFEIRIFNLKYRQPSGIAVNEAREYLRRFGGVHVYDAGFHLPYYGPDTDWLRIEMDHSHRISRSPLLPEDLKTEDDIASPLTFLPTNSRIFGAVYIDTNHEAAHSPSSARQDQSLSIQVTRDRLVDNMAYRNLAAITRYAVDFYALHEAQRSYRRTLGNVNQKEASTERHTRTVPLESHLNSIDALISSAANELPETVVSRLRREISAARDAASSVTETADRRVGLLGALATAGIAAIAQEHEAMKQYTALRAIIGRMRSTQLTQTDAQALEEWVSNAERTRAIFSNLLDERTRNATGTFLARQLVLDTVRQIRPLTRGVKIFIDDLSPELRLAPGGYVEWAALIQNVLVNATNATLDAPGPLIKIDGKRTNSRSFLRIQDNGSGVRLSEKEALFLPFERRSPISPERSRLGLGGTGLGLTIVRMLGDGMSVLTDFEDPEEGFATSFVAWWRDL